MKFDLVLKKELKKLDDFEFEIYEEDSLTEALSIVENSFYQSESIIFAFNCLGEDWPVHIFSDFSIFSQQLSYIYDMCLNNREEYLLDFFEQGLERKLLLLREKNTILIKNYSKDKWVSSVKEEIVKAEDIKNEVKYFVRKIEGFVNILEPKINQLSILKNWYLHFG